MKINDINCKIECTPFCSSLLYDNHCHLEFELIYIIDGNVEINVEGQKYMLKKNMAILIEPFKYHVVNGCNSVYNRMVIDFVNIIPEIIFTSFINSIKKNPIIFSAESTRLLNNMVNIANTNDNHFFPLFESYMIELFYLFAFSNRQNNSLFGPDKDSENTKKITRYIEDNIDKTISLQMLADELFMSVSSICHLFKNEMKISVKQYILRKKIYKSASLISSGTPPTLAAKLCGYENYPAFHKIFKSIMNKSPSELKKAGKPNVYTL